MTAPQTTTAPTTDLRALEDELNQMILNGQILEAFDRFYAENIAMQENFGDPSRGKALNRKREEEFLAAVEQFHNVELLGVGVGDGVSYSEWKFDYTMKGVGRLTYTQIAARRWENGQIVHERFYNPSAG